MRSYSISLTKRYEHRNWNDQSTEITKDTSVRTIQTSVALQNALGIKIKKHSIAFCAHKWFLLQYTLGKNAYTKVRCHFDH